VLFYSFLKSSLYLEVVISVQSEGMGTSVQSSSKKKQKYSLLFLQKPICLLNPSFQPIQALSSA
jgi:hypothetical protein